MSDNTTDTVENEEDRRKFLKVSAKIAAVAAAAGLASGTAQAQDNSKKIQSVVDRAIKTKNIEAALKSEGSGLDKRTAEALSSLSPKDLETLGRLQDKLGFIKTKGGTGVIIY